MSSQDRPYIGLAGSPQWTVIDRALQELARNRALVETTAHEYIVGYLCKALANTRTLGLDDGSDLHSTSKKVRSEALRSLRHAIKNANSEGRDLVQELIAERRLEGQRD